MGCSQPTGRTSQDDQAIDVIPPTSPSEEGDSPRTPRRSAARSFHREYALEESLGEGCFARVYACRKVIDGSEEQFAVKVTDLRGQKDELQERVARQEARILRVLGDCEHCCRLVDFTCCRRFHYIVLERCSMPLMAVLEGMSELTELSLAGFASQMLKAVACVHTHSVVHRDVKPDNFLCSGPENTVKLCDFGLAEVVREGGRRVAGQFGTAPFMSPEMISGGSYGTQTDVWSLGVILYTLVIGQFPYVPEKPCVKLMKAAVASGVPEPSFRCVAEGVELSSEVLDLVRSLITRDPEERPCAAAALHHPWLAPEAQGPRRPQHSLKAALSAAKKVGAFTSKHRTDEACPRSLDAMDLALQELQCRHQQQDRRFGLGPRGKEEDEETRTPSGGSASPKRISGSLAERPPRSPSIGTHSDRSPRSPSIGTHRDRSPSAASSKARPYGVIMRT